jgi:hypothetical protein
MYQTTMPRWGLWFAVVLWGCPAPVKYAVDRPGIDCARATRVAHKTMTALGYTITELKEPSAARSGAIGGTKTGADGKAHTGRVIITCSAKGAVLQPVEGGLVPGQYEFSRTFGYSFNTLVQRPDDETPWKSSGLQVLVQALDPFEARIDLGEVATVGDAVPVRVTIRNGTDRKVKLKVARLSLVDAGGSSHEPLAGSALAGAIASNAAGERVRSELFGEKPIAARETRVGFLVFPPGKYKEARVSIEDVETEESDGFVTPVE